MGGRPKALLPTGYGDETFLARIVAALREGGVDDVVVVAVTHVEAIVRAAHLLAPPVRVLRNRAPEQGQLSSLLVALKAIDHPGVGAMLVTLVDLPLVLPSTVRGRPGGIPADRCADRQTHTRGEARASHSVRPLALRRIAAC